MSADRIKLIITGCLYLGVILGTFGCTLLNKVADGISQEPIRRLRVIINESQRDELFEQFQKFAAKHSFEIDITDFNTNGEHFQVWISGNGVQIVADDDPSNSRSVSIDLYGIYLGYPVDEESVDALLTDLKSFINEIPNVTITEEK